MGSVPSLPEWRRAVRGPAAGFPAPFSRSSGDPCRLPALPALTLGRNASSDLFTDDQTAWTCWWPHSPWGFTSALTETPCR